MLVGGYDFTCSCGMCAASRRAKIGDRAARLRLLESAVVEAAKAWRAKDTLANNAALRAAVDALVTEERKP